MPRIPIENSVLQRLLYILNFHAHEYLPTYRVNGHLNDNALSIVENRLIDIGRCDLVEMLRETMTGNFTLLEEHERNLPVDDRFHNDHNQALCYHYMQNNNPIREEMSGRTENGNVVARSRDQGLSHQSEPLRNPRPREDRDLRTCRSQEGQRNPLWSVLEDRQLRSPQELTRLVGVAEPSFSLDNPPPEEPPQCCICGRNIQAIQNSRQIWIAITEIMNNLGSEQLRAFIVVNNYDCSVLNTIQFSQATSSREIVQVLMQRCHLTGRNLKCVFCLLNYVLQRIGRSDLATEIRIIRERFR